MFLFGKNATNDESFLDRLLSTSIWINIISSDLLVSPWCLCIFLTCSCFIEFNSIKLRKVCQDEQKFNCQLKFQMSCTYQS